MGPGAEGPRGRGAEGRNMGPRTEGRQKQIPVFSYIERRLGKKAMVNFKIYDVKLDKK